jgi:hypothetical protein
MSLGELTGEVSLTGLTVTALILVSLWLIFRP